MAPPIAKAELEHAITKGETGVRELLMGTKEKPYLEEEQRERTTQALAILQNQLQGMKSSEKMVIINVAREMTDRLKMEVERNVAIAEELKAGGVMDNVQTHGREIVKEMKEGDWWTRGKYIAGAVTGLVAMKWIWDRTAGWLWDKTVGDKEHPGIFRQIMNGIVMAGGAVLGAVGLSHILKSDNPILKISRHFGKGVVRGGEKIIKKFEGVGNATKETAQRVKEHIDKGEWAQAVWTGLGGGGVMIFEGGVAYLSLGAETFIAPWELANALWDPSKIPPGQNIWDVVGDTGIRYVCGSTALTFLLSGKRPSKKVAGIRILGGPVAMAWDLGKIISQLGTREGRQFAQVLMREHWIVRFFEEPLRHPLRVLSGAGNNVAAFEEAIDGLRKLQEMHKIKAGALGSHHPSVRWSADRINRLVVQLSDQLKIAKLPADAPQHLLQLQKELSAVTDPHEYLQFIHEYFKHQREVAAVLQKQKAVEQLVDSLRKGENVLDLLKKTKSLEDVILASAHLDDVAHIANIKSLLTVHSVEDLLKGGVLGHELMSAGVKATDIASACIKLDEMAKLNVLSHLLEKGVHVKELKASGVLFADILRAGGDAKEAIKAGAVAEDFIRGGRTLKEWVSVGGDATDFVKAERAVAAGTVKAAPKAPAGTPKAPSGTPKAPSGARVMQEGVMVPLGPARNVDVILREAKNAKNLRGAQLAETLQELQRTGRFPGLTDDVIHIATNGGARAEKIAAGYLRTGDVADVTKLTNAFGKAARTSIPTGLLGIGGDGLGIWVAYNDLQENYKNIEEARKTGNSALRELYESATMVNKVEIGIYSASAVLQFAGFFWAAAAGASVVAIPVTLVVGIGSMGYKEIQGHLEAWLREAKDWMKFPPETLMKCMMEHNDETLGRHISSLGNQTQYNNTTRYNLCKAYIALNTKVAKHPDEEADGAEGDKRFRQRESEFLEDQIGYVSWATNRTYIITDPIVFEQARTHARLSAAARQARALREQGITTPMTTTIKGKDGKERVIDLAEYGPINSSPDKDDYQDKRNRMMQISADSTENMEGSMLTQLASLAQNPAEFARQAPQMIVGMMRDSISFIEGKILKWDDTFSGRARRWWNSDVAVSRGFIADQLKNGINAIITAVVQKKEVSVDAMTKHIANIRTMLRNTDPNSKLPPEAEGNRAYYESIGKDTQLLTPPGIVKLINDYPVIPPREAAESPDQATSIVALIAHATPVNAHSHVREFTIKANSQGVANVKNLKGWHYDVVNPNGSLQMLKNSMNFQHAMHKGTYLFWQPVHTPHSNKAELLLRVE